MYFSLLVAVRRRINKITEKERCAMSKARGTHNTSTSCSTDMLTVQKLLITDYIILRL